MKDPSSRLMKFRLTLEEYDFTVEYVKGKDNCAADALSRIKISCEELKDINRKSVNVMTRAQRRKKDKSDISLTDYLEDTVPTDNWPDQPKVVETHIKPKECIEMRHLNNKKELENIKRVYKNHKVSKNKTFCYVPSTIYINPEARSQLTPEEFVRELGVFCEKIDVDEIYFIKNNSNKIFVKRLINEIKILIESRGTVQPSKIQFKIPRVCILNDTQIGRASCRERV